MSDTDRWSIAADFLVRSTGFPIDLLQQIACPDTAAAIDDLCDLDSELVAQAERCLTSLGALSADVPLKLRRRCFRRISGGVRCSLSESERESLGACAEEIAAWDRVIEQRALRRAHVDELFRLELVRTRAALRSIASTERFQEAVWLSSPQMFVKGLVPYVHAERIRSEQRRCERQLVAYLQRFCAKNDTSSFFGPIDYGCVGETAGLSLVAGRTHRRVAFLAHWAVVELVSAIAADPGVTSALIPTRASTVTYRSDREGRISVQTSAGARSGRFRPVGTLAGAVLAAVDGLRRVADITAHVRDKCAEAADLDVPDVVDLLGTLHAAGLVHLTPHVPVTVAHPSQWLREWIMALVVPLDVRQRWLDRVQIFFDVEEQFGCLSFTEKQPLLRAAEDRFTDVTGGAARRGGGTLYADRLLFYEEAVGNAHPLTLSDAAYTRIRAGMSPVLDVFAAHALTAQADVLAAGVRHLHHLTDQSEEEPREPPLSAVVASLRDVPLPDPPAAWREAVMTQLIGRHDERHVALDVGRLPRATAVAGREPLLTSMDLMLVADSWDDVCRGRFDIVIGEFHDQLLVWGWPLHFHADRARVQARGAAILAATHAGRRYGNVEPTRRVKIIPFQYPGPAITLGPAPSPEARDVVPLAAVRARVDRGGRPVLYGPGTGDFGLYNAEQQTLAHRIFAPPRLVPPPAVEAGTHTPRLSIDGVVVQRERWRVRRGDLFGADTPTGDDVTLMIRYRSAARELALPRYVFARVEGDRKPMFVDGDSWMSLQALSHLTADDDRDVILTEMLPGPGQLWFTGETGRHCSEFRMTAYLGASDTGPGWTP